MCTSAEAFSPSSLPLYKSDDPRSLVLLGPDSMALLCTQYSSMASSISESESEEPQSGGFRNILREIHIHTITSLHTPLKPAKYTNFSLKIPFNVLIYICNFRCASEQGFLFYLALQPDRDVRCDALVTPAALNAIRTLLTFSPSSSLPLSRQDLLTAANAFDRDSQPRAKSLHTSSL